MSLEEGYRQTGQQSKVTPQDATLELGLKKNMSLLCAEWDSMSCSNSSLLKRWGHVRGGKKSRSCPFLTMLLCSGVTAPGVDNNGVILLSVAASLTLTDHFSSALLYHSRLSWHSADCFPIWVFVHSLAQFRLHWWSAMKMETYTNGFNEKSRAYQCYTSSSRTVLSH